MLLNLLQLFSLRRYFYIQDLTHFDTTTVRESNIDSAAKNDDEGLEAWGSSKLRVFDRAILDITWCEENYRFYSGWPVCCCYLWGKTYGNFFYIYLIFSQHLIYFHFFFETYGCMNRVGITTPPITITTDNKRH